MTPLIPLLAEVHERSAESYAHEGVNVRGDARDLHRRRARRANRARELFERAASECDQWPDVPRDD